MKQCFQMLLCSAIVSMYGVTIAAEDYDIDKEISRFRKELSSVNAQRKTVRDETVKDQKEYAVYTTRTKKRLETIRSEIDSIQKDILFQKVINDSLTSAIATLRNSGHQTELLQNNFRERLIAGCEKYKTATRKFSPMITKTVNASLSFLKSELVSKNIDNIEGIQRLTVIIKDIEEAAGSIQIVQGASPVSEIRGTTYQIRMGMLFEAVVNTDGTLYALWRGYEPDGKVIWQMGKDPAIAEELLKCVNVREGKTLPAFIELPLTDNGTKGVSQ